MKRRKINNIVEKAKNDIASSSTRHLTRSVVHSLLVGDGLGSSKALYIYARHFNRSRHESLGTAPVCLRHVQQYGPFCDTLVDTHCVQVF